MLQQKVQWKTIGLEFATKTLDAVFINKIKKISSMLRKRYKVLVNAAVN